jgi:hypothetical protein
MVDANAPNSKGKTQVDVAKEVEGNMRVVKKKFNLGNVYDFGQYNCHVKFVRIPLIEVLGKILNDSFNI